MSLHKNMTLLNNHVVHTYAYATQAAMWAATGFAADDLGKYAYVADDDSVWVLQAATPIWLPVSGVARCKLDWSGGGTSGSTYGLDVIIPDNFVLAYAYYDVVNTFSSNAGNDAATIQLHLPTDGDIVAGVAISAATDWDAGQHDTIQDWTGANMMKATGNREVSYTIGGGENLEAGLLYLYLFYHQSS